VNINDILHFAPDIPFNGVDWNGNKLPEQFYCRIEGFYLEPAVLCVQNGHAFAAGLLLVSCIDALARLKYRSNDVGKRFKWFLARELKSFGNQNVAQRFYDEVRNGLVHEARLKEGAQFTLDPVIDETVTIRIGDVLLVNPRLLFFEIQNALDAYVELLKKDERELRLLSASLILDLDKDIHVANQY